MLLRLRSVRTKRVTTLRRIASTAGVHVGTVAAVLNRARGNTRVGAETRERVLRAARELGYVRNESARRLRTGRSDAVGFIGGDVRNPFFAELSALLEAELAARGLPLVHSHGSAAQGHSVDDTVNLMHREAIRRIIYWQESPMAVPTVTPETLLLPIGFTTRPGPGVWLDLKAAIRLAVTTLRERGLRRMGFYAPSGKLESPSVTLRRKMFLSECLRQKLPAPVCATYAGESWNVEEAVAGARALLARRHGVQAFLAFNDVAALGLLLADPSSGKRPLVVCFDGTALTRCWPGATLVLDLQAREMAQRAVAVVTGELDAAVSGARNAWLQPGLFG